MRTYQTLGLIGSIIGLFLSLALVAIGGVLTGLIEVDQNMSESLALMDDKNILYDNLKHFAPVKWSSFT